MKLLQVRVACCSTIMDTDWLDMCRECDMNGCVTTVERKEAREPCSHGKRGSGKEDS